MAESQDDPLDPVIAPAPSLVPADWPVQPSHEFQPETDLVPAPPSRRWPIVAAFLGFAILVASSVGYFLRSPTPVATRDPKAVEETTIDLPESPPPARPAPDTELPARLPAPTPSRPASGAVAGSQKPERGRLLIRSSPADADVLVNGRALGKTPLTLRDLDLGSYTIRVARDGYAAEERILQVTPRRPTASATFTLRETPAFAPRVAAGAPAGKPGAAADKPGGISVRSRPAGARVFVNDRLVGSTPLVLPNVPAGSATVRIELDGYRGWITTVQIGAGEQASVAASLERQ